MDVEILKKVNTLAKSLHEQGLAANMDDATKLAQNMVGVKSDEAAIYNYGNNTTKQQAVQVEKPIETMVQESQEPEIIQQEPQNNINLDEFKNQINELQNKVTQSTTQSTNNYNFIQQIGNEIDKINSKINQLEQTIRDLRAQLIRPVETPKPVEQQVTQEQPKQESNSGELTPDNIDIRNYFYTGNDK